MCLNWVGPLNYVYIIGQRPLWVVLAVCVISGVIIGWYIANVFGLMAGIVAAVLFGGAGLFAGLFFVVFGGGLVSMLLNVSDRLDELAGSVSRIEKNRGEPGKAAGEREAPNSGADE